MTNICIGPEPRSAENVECKNCNESMNRETDLGHEADHLQWVISLKTVLPVVVAVAVVEAAETVGLPAIIAVTLSISFRCEILILIF